MPETHLRIQRTAGYGGLAALLCGLVLIWHDGRQPVAAAADSFHSAAGAISQSPSPVLLAGGALLFFGVVTLCLAAGIFLMRRILAVRTLRVVPWILAALVGSFSRGVVLSDTLLAAPSPFYVVAISGELLDTTRDPTPAVIVCTAVAGAWALLGLGLLESASLRCRRIIREHEQALAEGEAFLRAEDEGRAAPPPAS